MVLTPSVMVKLGNQAPDFSLRDVVTGRIYSLFSLSAKKILLVMFICRHCPYVQHVKKELTRLSMDYAQKNLAFVAISSNDARNYPEDAPQKLKEMALEEGWRFPFLYDETQETAKRYMAACTPEFFMYDQKRELIYRGQLDDSRPGNGKPLTGKDLRDALNAALADRPPAEEQKASIGCNIKWKRDNEPEFLVAGGKTV